MISAKVKLAVDGGAGKSRWVALHGDLLWVLATWVTDSQAQAATVAELPQLAEKAIHVGHAKVEATGFRVAVSAVSAHGPPGYIGITLGSLREAERWARLLEEAAGQKREHHELLDRVLEERAASPQRQRSYRSGGSLSPRSPNGFHNAATSPLRPPS